MLASYVEMGGPGMYAVLATWIVVLAGVLDRGIYVLGRLLRRPATHIHRLVDKGRLEEARLGLARERARAERGATRIDAVSKLATSVGLFGTVLGIAQSFLVRGAELQLAAPDVLARGLSTALFTTIAGLIVFLFGQAFLIAYDEWLAWCEGELAARTAVGEAAC